MKTRPRPITKLPILVEIVPDMYPEQLVAAASMDLAFLRSGPTVRPLKRSDHNIHKFFLDWPSN